MRLFDPRLMKLLTFLTRRQAWLAPNEISQDFRPDGGRITARTILGEASVRSPSSKSSEIWPNFRQV